MNSSDLDAFIRTAKGSGIADGDLVALLRHHGWSERRVFRSLSGYYAETLGVPLPARSTAGEASRDAFLYLLYFITLSFWVVGLGNLLYVLIAHAFPEAVRYDYGRSLMDEIAFQLATIIVALPAFLAIHRIIARELAHRPDLYESGVRSWLTYVALVFAGLTVLVDAIWTLQAFLTGTVTTRFLLDSLVLAVLGGGVFAYYLATLQPRRA
jgi:hypothetical protein